MSATYAAALVRRRSAAYLVSYVRSGLRGYNVTLDRLGCRRSRVGLAQNLKLQGTVRLMVWSP